ncbi:proprotein convertase P-domain-containing protein [Candidatus Sumerlaeota bacterium]|nr:proprotein convertase P-domain-containing protein [Candidatus Sumerlaeota bacterium]
MKRILFSGIILVFLFTGMASYALDVESVRRAIAEKNAGWTAADNRLSRLSLTEQKRLLGVLENPASPLPRKIDSKSMNIDARVSLKDLPANLDWRNHNSGNWVSPVRDQNPWGSCAAFASIACLESHLKIQSGNPTLDVDLSERFIFAYGGGGATKGWWTTQAADFLMTVGAVPESACPYAAWDGSPPDDSAQVYLNSHPTYLIEDWAEIFYIYIPKAENEIKVKNALMEAPVVVLMDVYEDFLVYSGGVYERVTGSLLGPHAILLIGWDDAQDCWICKNSWGESWGESGFFRIRKSNMGNSNFPDYAYRFYPRDSPGMCYYSGSQLPAVVPDAGYLSSDSDVRGLAGATDVTFQVSLIHQRMEDLSCLLTSPLGASSVMMYQKPASSTHLTEFFLNDKSAFTLSDLVAARDSMGFVGFRGCAKPDNPISPLLYSSPYGYWNLKVSDNVSGESGVLESWGVYFAANRVTASHPELWNKY